MSGNKVFFNFDTLLINNSKDLYQSISNIVDRVNKVIRYIDEGYTLANGKKCKANITAQMGLRYVINGLDRCKLMWFCDKHEVLQDIKLIWDKVEDKLPFQFIVDFNTNTYIKPKDKVLSDDNVLVLNPLIFTLEGFKNEIEKRYKTLKKIIDRDDLMVFPRYGYTFLDFNLDYANKDKVVANTYYKVVPDNYLLSNLILSNKL